VSSVALRSHSENMKILAFFTQPSHVAYGKLVGGIQRRFLEISSGLRKLGVEVSALEYGPPLAERWGYSAAYNPIELNRRFQKHLFLDVPRLLVQALVACLKLKCDIVYVPGRLLGGDRVFAIAPLIVSFLCRKPLVIVFHHLRPRDYGEKNPIALLAYAQAKVCIAVSKSTANEIAENFKTRRIAVAGNGVNPELFKRVEKQRKEYDAVYFGRISQEKGIHTLLLAWKIVIQKAPSAQLLLMGGTVGKLEAYERIVAGLKLEQNVSFTGFVSDEQAVTLLNSSRIFVLPSTGEGFGLTVAEAMAAGLPCIVSDLPALRENFGSAAILAKVGDEKGLAQAMLDLMLNPEECEQVRERGRQLVQQLSWANVAKKELRILESAIKP